jgi:hypothetical protein
VPPNRDNRSPLDGFDASVVVQIRVVIARSPLRHFATSPLRHFATLFRTRVGDVATFFGEVAKKVGEVAKKSGELAHHSGDLESDRRDWNTRLIGGVPEIVPAALPSSPRVRVTITNPSENQLIGATSNSGTNSDASSLATAFSFWALELVYTFQVGAVFPVKARPIPT